MSKKESKSNGVKRASHTKTKARMKVFFSVFIWALIIGLLIVGGRHIWKTYIGPSIEMSHEARKVVANSTEDTFKASQTSLVYDKDDNLLLSLKGEKDVYYLEYDEIPDAFKLAMISIEDKKFVTHRGVDVKAIARAALSFVRHKGEITQGGSTITQQLARNVFLTHKVSWERKVEEIFISMALEQKYSKEDILEFYLNNIYFANGYYGIQAASKGYFRKTVDKLTLSQMVFLCAIPNNPTLYNPLENKENTLKRRDRILQNLYEDDYINKEQYEEALAEEIDVKDKKKRSIRDYVETYIFHCATESLMENNGFQFKYTFKNEEQKEEYQKKYKESYTKWQDTLYTSGYRIYTSIDLDLQDRLQNSVDQNLVQFTKKNDEGVYDVQGSATCIDNDTGLVVAIVGGRKQANLEGYTLNRAFKDYRQPGSAIKPLMVYAPMLERGMTPNSTVDDSRLQGDDVPSNSGGWYSGRITLRRAVQKSSNVATYRLYQELTPQVSLEYLEKMNFSNLAEEDYEYLTTCLGGFTYGTNTLEMTAAYAALANDGVYRKPTCIVKITDAKGNVIMKEKAQKKQIYTETAARMMTDVLESVVNAYPGTARNCKLYNQPAAAKTGTTTSNIDGWLCGYTPYYTTCVWVGSDSRKEVDGLTGSSYPGNIWKEFMQEIHENLERKDFPTYGGQQQYNTYRSYSKTTAAKSETETQTSEETQQTETAATEAPTTEVPATEAPTTEAPATEAPATEAPATEAPATEAPATEAPAEE